MTLSAAEETQPQTHTLENIHKLAPSVFSGSEPATADDFQRLRSLGVRSILSVDGASPNVALAHEHALVYAHVPIAYAGVDPADTLAIARVIRDLPRPIYVHCHHGKHRGPAAAALGLVCTGELTPGQGLAFMDLAGTSPSYAGLFEAVGEARKLATEEISGVPMPPETAPVPDLVRSMAQIDRAFDHLKLVEASDWRAPPSHPDLVAVNEAALIHDRLRAMRIEPRHARRDDARFHRLLRAAEDAALGLEESLRRDPAQASGAIEDLDRSCVACHAIYR